MFLTSSLAAKYMYTLQNKSEELVNVSNIIHAENYIV